MSEYKINRLSPEKLAERQAQHERATIYEWEFTEGNLVMGYFPNHKEAVLYKERCERIDEMTDRLNDLISEFQNEKGYSLDEINEAVSNLM